jgi:hypothetical protein
MGKADKMKRLKLAAIALMALLLIPSYPQVQAQEVDWMLWAERAMNYFQPGVGVDPNTGLHRAGLYWPYFTDWDLGEYIVALVDAQALGLLPRTGPWSFRNRIQRVLDFLLTRPLGPNGVPYLWYKAEDGTPWTDTLTNVYDAGRLLVALDYLRRNQPRYARTIDKVIERHNYTYLAVGGMSGAYGFYVAYGFKAFGFDRYPQVRQAIEQFRNALHGPTVSVYGVQLPKVDLTFEPLLRFIFEVGPDPEIRDLLYRMYLAHEARYLNEGRFTAFSEGNTGLNDPSYVYEWVVRSDGRTWVLTSPGKGEVSITPIAYAKVAFALHALYNTSYTEALIAFTTSGQAAYDDGIQDGVDEDGRTVDTIIDKTNSLVISAARWALIKDMKIWVEDVAVSPDSSSTGEVIVMAPPGYEGNVRLSVRMPRGVRGRLYPNRGDAPFTSQLIVTATRRALGGYYKAILMARDDQRHRQRLYFTVSVLAGRVSLTGPKSVQAVVNEPVTVTLRIENLGTIPITSGHIDVRLSPIRVQGPGQIPFGQVEPSGYTLVTVTLTPIRRGSASVTFTAYGTDENGLTSRARLRIRIVASLG